VLARFDPDEQPAVDEMVAGRRMPPRLFLASGIAPVMNGFNNRKEDDLSERKLSASNSRIAPCCGTLAAEPGGGR
jgi:hypothetical protein